MIVGAFVLFLKKIQFILVNLVQLVGTCIMYAMPEVQTSTTIKKN